MDKHLNILCILKLNQKTIYSSALIDSGVSGYGFIDHSYTHKHDIPMILLNTPWTLKAFNGKSIEHGLWITYIARIDYLSFDIYKEYNLYLYISHLHYYSIVLGHFWFWKQNSHIQ